MAGEGRAWVEAALDEVRAHLARRFAHLADLRLMPSDTRVSGKLLRPRLLLTVAATRGADVPTSRAVAMASAVEMVHLATLHHDDVLDDAPHRRRAMSVRETFGNKASILFGDALVAGALEIVLRSANRRMQLCLVHAVTATLRGEVEQHLGHRVLELSPVECVRVARLKTGSLFALSARLGAMLGGGDGSAAAIAARMGRRLGTAYQLIDDALDYAGSPDLLGKDPGADYRQGIATLPLVRAWRASSDGDRRILQAGFGQEAPGDFATVREIVLRREHFESCLASARRYLRGALDDLRTVALDGASPPLREYIAEVERRVPDPDHVRLSRARR